MDLSDLGFLPVNWERYQRAFHKPHGTILVTGPTGSGKSTTLYATLNLLTWIGARTRTLRLGTAVMGLVSCNVTMPVVALTGAPKLVH